VTGLETNPNQVEVLRWPAWREQRGGIKDLAVSSNGKRVLVGGYGLRVATVALLDHDPPAEGTPPRIAQTWPKTRPGLDSFRTVPAVSLSSDGKTAAFATEDGSVWLWKPKELEKEDDAGRWFNTPLWVGRHAAFTKPADMQPFKELDTPPSLRLFFHNGDRQLVSVNRAGEVWQFDVTDTSRLSEVRDQVSAPAKKLFSFGEGKKEFELFRAVYDAGRDRLIVAVHHSPKVLVRSLTGNDSFAFTLPNEHFARSMAVDPKTGTLAVAVGTVVPKQGAHQFHNDADDAIWVYRKPAAGAQPDLKISRKGQAEAMTFHPKEDRLAIGGGDASEVTLYDLAAAKNPISVAQGVGRKPWELALTANGQLVGVRTQRNPTADLPNHRGTGPVSGFNLQTGKPLTDLNQKWIGVNDTADDWTVEPDQMKRDLWYAVHKNGVRVPLEHDSKQHNKPTCYTFLPANKNHKETWLLVGHYHGASLYELAKDQPAKPLAASRVFYGHAGEVLSIAALDDPMDVRGGWFITGGADHTLAAYSLRAWEYHPTLGVSFEIKAGAIVVKDVAVGSPGWEAGLRKGETLELLCVGGSERGIVYDRRTPAKVTANQVAETYTPTTEFRPSHLLEKTQPGTAFEILNHPRPRVQLYLGLRSAKGEYRELNTAVTQRPLWKLFLGYDDALKVNDWVIWMWKGSYFRTESAEGDRKVGWHVNGPTTRDQPQFYALTQFAETADREKTPLLQRKDVIQKLIATRDVKAALEDALGNDPQAPDVNFYRPDAIRYEPEPVAVGVDQHDARDRSITVTVSVNPRGKDIDLLPERVELWVNDYRFQSWDVKPGAKFSQKIELPPNVFRTGENQITALTFNPGRGRGEARRSVTFDTAQPRETNTLALGIGVNNYGAHQAVAQRGEPRSGYPLKNLVWANGDAAGVVEQLRKLTAGQAESFEVALDGKADRDGLLRKLRAIGEKVKSPDDVMVVFLAGHGVLTPTEGRATKPGSRGALGGTGQFVFCCHDFDPSRVRETSVSADELVDTLATINCRKVLLLDVCHSGQATEANVLRRFLPPGQGPFILTACDQSESAFEDPKAGRGFFTSALLDAFGPGFGLADKNSDRKLSGEELYHHVSQKLPELLLRAGKNDPQTPMCFPRPASDVWVVRKPAAR
jgi:hypothetical protein